MGAWNFVRKLINRAGDAGARSVRSAAERLSESRRSAYEYQPPAPEVLRRQREAWRAVGAGECPARVLGPAAFIADDALAPKFSVLMYLYEPVQRDLEHTIRSLLEQTYAHYEIMVVDAGAGDGTERFLASFASEKIHYERITGVQAGRAQCLNRAALMASGDYVTYVDEGDMFTPDALHEMAVAAMRTGAEILYSDEDVCDMNGRTFYNPSRKPDYNKDYLLATDYTRHLLMVRRELFLALGLRPAYDGALSYDLILRAPKTKIRHVPQVLYHCCSVNASDSDLRLGEGGALEKGRAALLDYFRQTGVSARVEFSTVPGFYEISYEPDVFSARPDIGVIGGKILNRSHRVIGGMFDAVGRVLFEGWDESEGGPMNQALTLQDAWAVDVRCMEIRPELHGLYREIFGRSYEEHILDMDEGLREKSIRFCQRARALGYLILWDPHFIRVV